MSRRAARSQAMERVYQALLTEDTDPLIDRQLDEDDRIFADAIVNGVFAHRDELNDLIADRAKGYSLSRIFKVDLAILLVAAYEIRYAGELSGIAGESNKAIVCNEAVLMAKKYSTLKSPSFINGILAKID